MKLNTPKPETSHVKEEIFSAIILGLDLRQNIKAITTGTTNFKKQVFKNYKLSQKQFEIEYCYFQASLPFYIQDKIYAPNK